jgi:hypothetical protein
MLAIVAFFKSFQVFPLLISPQFGNLLENIFAKADLIKSKGTSPHSIAFPGRLLNNFHTACPSGISL